MTTTQLIRYYILIQKQKISKVCSSWNVFLGCYTELWPSQALVSLVCGSQTFFDLQFTEMQFRETDTQQVSELWPRFILMRYKQILFCITWLQMLLASIKLSFSN